METAKKIIKYALMGLGGFLVFAVIMGMLFGEDTTTLVAPTTTIETTSNTTIPTTVAAPAATTTRHVTTTTEPAPTDNTVSRSALRDLWVVVVRQSSADYSTLTWADVMTDQEMIGILDVICETFESGVVERGNDRSIAEYAVLYGQVAPDGWTDDDTTLLAFAFGAASHDRVCP